MKRKEYSYRKSWFNHLVLIVREERCVFNHIRNEYEVQWGEWRDASTQDLIEYYIIRNTNET